MKLRAPLLATFLLALLAVAAHAGTFPVHSVGGSAGLIAPMGDFADQAGTGWFLGGSYNYRFNANWAAGIDLDYFSFGEKSWSVPGIGGTHTHEQSAYGGQSQLYAKYFVPMRDDRFQPYLKAGYFHYRIGFKTTSTYGGSSSSNTDKQQRGGFGLGVGAAHPLNEKSAVGLELLYGQIATSPDASNLWQLGLNYTFALGR